MASRANVYGVEVVAVEPFPNGARVRITWADGKGGVGAANTHARGRATTDAHTWVKPGSRVDLIRDGRGTIIVINKAV